MGIQMRENCQVRSFCRWHLIQPLKDRFTDRDEGRWNLGQWYLHKQENMGKAEKKNWSSLSGASSVMQEQWGTKGHLSDTISDLECLIKAFILNSADSGLTSTPEWGCAPTGIVLGEINYPQFREAQSQKWVAISSRHLDQARGHSNLDSGGSWIGKKRLLG